MPGVTLLRDDGARIQPVGLHSVQAPTSRCCGVQGGRVRPCPERRGRSSLRRLQGSSLPVASFLSKRESPARKWPLFRPQLGSLDHCLRSQSHVFMCSERSVFTLCSRQRWELCAGAKGRGRQGSRKSVWRRRHWPQGLLST